MALNKLKFSSINVTPVANQAIKFNSSANGFETGSAGGAITFIKKLTASSSSTLSFVDGSSDVVLDNTYKEYLFIFNNIHPQTDAQKLTFQGNASGGSGYNETITSTFFRAYSEESGTTALSYDTGGDQAQGTSYQQISDSVGSDTDQCCSGFLHLFNPSSTTFVKHFIARTNTYQSSDYSIDVFSSGYFNTTSAIDEIQFKMASGNIDSGTITLYGIN
jgi:hypothetical protein|tara:strand:- start:1 stop:657 length:657 start_codon:yes stop_codon:yes gene_type:complete